MGGLTILLAPARLSAQLLGGTVRVATAPARATFAAIEAVAEDLRASLRSSPPPPPAPGAPSSDGPDAVTPSIARTPGARRTRTRISDPQPPVVTPGLLEQTGEAPGEARDGAELLPGQPEDTASMNGGGAAAGARPADPLGGDTHIVVEETLVAEVADPGSADGAGAELHVAEPWPGYGAMKAGEVLDRLPVQDEASLSVLLLFERSHRARKSVIAAAERELARRS
jgi:hypothetical protein